MKSKNYEEEESFFEEEIENPAELDDKGISLMTKTVIFSIGFVVLYTIWTQIAVIKWGVEPNDTLTEWVYKFFGIEITLMCAKRIVDKFLIRKSRK